MPRVEFLQRLLLCGCASSALASLPKSYCEEHQSSKAVLGLLQAKSKHHSGVEFTRTVVDPEGNRKRMVAVAAMFGHRDCLGDCTKGELKHENSSSQTYAGLSALQVGESLLSTTLPKLPAGFDGVFYTDDPSITVAPGAHWRIVRTPYHSLKSGTLPEAILNASTGHKHSWTNVEGTGRQGVMAARFYKLNAYALPETEGYEVIVWIDAHVFTKEGSHHSLAQYQCKNDSPPSDLVLTSLGESDLVMGWHPSRTHVEEELGPAGKRCSETQDYDECEKDVEAAWSFYTADGFKDDAGLFWSGFFAYRRDAIVVQDFLRQWWVQILSYSFRDQVSLPYVISKFDGRLQFKGIDYDSARELNTAMMCLKNETVSAER